MALKIAVTTGDPAGIGPEISLKSLSSLKNKDIIPVLIGRREIYEAHFPEKLDDFTIIEGRDGGKLPQTDKIFYSVDVNCPVPQLGKGTPDTGKESLVYIDTALSLWKAGEVDALVTGPVSKALIEKSGTPFTGHTEYIASSIGEDFPFMMMFSQKYRVLLATTHIPLNRVTENISVDWLLRVIRQGHASIKAIDGGEVRLAITGLDPHCGDDGAISSFDRDITARAVKMARQEGIPIEGPFAADTIFMREKWEHYNLIITHYHDQGLIPFKMIAFESGVNVTIGLSIIRTSVDHGTAFDIAGKGVAEYSSMVEAIDCAVRLCKNGDL